MPFETCYPIPLSAYVLAPMHPGISLLPGFSAEIAVGSSSTPFWVSPSPLLQILPH